MTSVTTESIPEARFRCTVTLGLAQEQTKLSTADTALCASGASLQLRPIWPPT